jgi:hypothetical protein
LPEELSGNRLGVEFRQEAQRVFPMAKMSNQQGLFSTAKIAQD